MIGSNSTSRAEGGASPLTRKKEQGCIHQVPKKADQKIQSDISYLKSNCEELEENRSTRREADETQGNAGEQFGGHKGKKQQKRSD